MTWQNERRLRQEIADTHRRLYELGFSVANDGNTSVRVDRDRILITPAGLNKAKLTASQMAVIDRKGNPISGNYPKSSEFYMHIALYNARPDLEAVIHAHPPYAIACSLAGLTLEEPVLPEVITTLGKIPSAGYVTPGTKEVGEAVAKLMKEHDAIILDRHGAVTVGATLEDAMQKMERVEHTAKIAAIARAMGAVAPLPQHEVERLLKVVGKTPPPVSSDDGNEGKLIDLITREVKAALNDS